MTQGRLQGDHFKQLDKLGEHETDQQIADHLGVSREWVRDVRLSMVQGDKFGGDTNFITQEIKQEVVREYIAEHPDKSDRKVSEEVGVSVSQPTVGNIREDMDEEVGYGCFVTDTTTCRGIPTSPKCQ